MTGRWAEGESVPTAEALASTFDVSRTVARETLQALASAGLISVRQGRRTVSPMHQWRFVDDLVRHTVASGQVEPKLAADLREVRIVLEVSASARCAHSADVATAAELRDVAERQHALTQQSPAPLDEIAACDLRFHCLIAEGSDNRILLELINGLRQQLVPTWRMETLSAQEHWETAREHLAIAEAISAGDKEQAATVMREHLRRPVLLAVPSHAPDPRSADQCS